MFLLFVITIPLYFTLGHTTPECSERLVNSVYLTGCLPLSLYYPWEGGFYEFSSTDRWGKSQVKSRISC